MKKLALLGMMAVLFTACAMPQGGMKKSGGMGLFGTVAQPVQSDQFVDEAVEVVTDPAGMRVNINGGLVGYSPVKAAVRRYWRGEPGNMTLDPVAIEALAAAAGQCDQSGIFGDASTKVPAPVRFNMAACAAAQPAAVERAVKRRK